MRTITQNDVALIKQRNKKIRMKVTLLNELGVPIENIVGKVLPSPSYEVDAESDIRRTSSLSLAVQNKDQMALDFENTWNKRMVELSLGIFSNENKDYVWYPLGRMLMSGGSTVYGATTQQVNLNLVDLMASISEERGSQIGTPISILAGTNIKDALETFISEYGTFKRNNICEFPDTVPHDILSDVGDYPIQVIQKVIDLFPYYEMFYSLDGIFTIQQIPTKIDDPVDIGHDIIDELLISETKTVDFSEVKNTTEIWGAEVNGDYFLTSCVQTNDTYIGEIGNAFEVLENGATFTIIPDADSVAGQKLKIQDTAACLIVNAENGGTSYTPIPAGTLQAQTGYVVRYFEGMFVLVGELLIRCIVQEINGDEDELLETVKQQFIIDNACKNVKWIFNKGNPLACTINPLTHLIEGEKRQVFNDEEYGSIYSIDLAYERAYYENWLKCRMQDTVDLEMVLIPWMDVNDKIEYTSPVTGEVGTWLVKRISYNFSNCTMTVTASRFYQSDPWE